MNIKRSTRRIGVSLVGFPAIFLGIILLVLPGPGLLIIALGLLILSLEFEWAHNYLDKVKAAQKKAALKARRNRK
jgi:hypothetical protein